VPDINANSTDLRRSIGGSQYRYVLPKRMIHRLRVMRVMSDEECLERHDGRGQPLEVVHASITASMYHFSTRDSGLKNSGLVYAIVGGP
jgi:hypothetical protein